MYIGGGVLGFDPEPSLTIVVFWAERFFRTHPPSKAAALPGRGTRQNEFPLGHFTGAPSEKLPRNAEHCRTNSPRLILRETLREAAPERGTRHNSKEGEF